MENLVIIGVNTRPQVNSGLKLNYNVLSSSYFTCIDFPSNVFEKHILNETEDESCGSFEENYHPVKLLDNIEEYLDNADKIILTSGIIPEDFQGRYKKYLKKIVGNKKTRDISSKFNFYKKLSDKFLMPETFPINDIYELCEILKNYSNTNFILKPDQGSGGYNTILLDYKRFNENGKLKIATEKLIENSGQTLLQEYISGINISSSVLSSKNNAKCIMNTRLLTRNDLGYYNDYRYSGNILPLNTESIKAYTKTKIPDDNETGMKNLNRNMNNLSEDIVKELKLIGSNGVDLILSDKDKTDILNNDIYLIEVNPRFQGTYESVEKTLGINLLEEHINACNNQLINEIPESKTQCIKEIIYSPYKIKQGNLNLNNLYDISRENTIIEKDEPLATIIQECEDIKKGIEKMDNLKKEIKNNIIKIE